MPATGGDSGPAASLNPDLLKIVQEVSGTPNPPLLAGLTTFTQGESTKPVDWRSYLADWGFPPDVVAELDRIFRTYNDPNQAGQAALAYIRGTQWYAQTFPGIQEGIKLGVITDERGYRDYVNQLNQFYRRFNNRDVTTQEVSDYLKKGVGILAVSQHLAGGAYVQANLNDIQYANRNFGDSGSQGLDADQLSALGDQAGGLDNIVGTQLQAKLDKARQRIQSIFSGTTATPALSVLNNGNLGATSFGAGKNADVSA